MFQLAPRCIADRVRSTGTPLVLPSLGASIVRGIVGFTIVSVAGFLPWPIFDLWIHGIGERELYIVCTAVFIGISGPCMHRLIFGPGSLSRFYKLFSLAFIAYAVVWIALWTTLRSDTGVVLGLLGGTAAMGAILCQAFGAWKVAWKVITALFSLNTLGYFVGGKIAGKLIIDHPVIAMLVWGVCYGAGFGAGLGAAFHFCQEQARTLLRVPQGTARVRQIIARSHIFPQRNARSSESDCETNLLFCAYSH